MKAISGRGPAFLGKGDGASAYSRSYKSSKCDSQSEHDTEMVEVEYITD